MFCWLVETLSSLDKALCEAEAFWNLQQKIQRNKALYPSRKFLFIAPYTILLMEEFVNEVHTARGKMTRGMLERKRPRASTIVVGSQNNINSKTIVKRVTTKRCSLANRFFLLFLISNTTGSSVFEFEFVFFMHYLVSFTVLNIW